MKSHELYPTLPETAVTIQLKVPLGLPVVTLVQLATPCRRLVSNSASEPINTRMLSNVTSGETGFR